MAVNSLNSWQICLIHRTLVLRLDNSPVKWEVAEARLAAIKRSQECLADSESSWHCWQGPTKWPEPSAKEQEGPLGQLLQYRGRSSWMAVTSLLTSWIIQECLLSFECMWQIERKKWGMKVINNYFCFNREAERKKYTHHICMFLTWKTHPHTPTHTQNQQIILFSLLPKHEAQFLRPKIHF